MMDKSIFISLSTIFLNTHPISNQPCGLISYRLLRPYLKAFLVIGSLFLKSIQPDWNIIIDKKIFIISSVGFPNVEFAPILAEWNQLITNAELVFVTVGTSGWEAILQGIPVLSPVKFF